MRLNKVSKIASVKNDATGVNKKFNEEQIEAAIR